MSVTLPRAPAVDRETLRDAVREEYQEVARDPGKDFHFHTGRRLAAILGYEEALLEGIPEPSIASFAGTGNPFSMGALRPGEKVVDIGCGAGIDSLIAAKMVGPEGRVIGVDMTPAMLERAESSRRAAGVEHLELEEGYGEKLPVPDGWADVIISNGVFNLMPDKLGALDEMARVLRPGGRLQIADILVQKPVSEKAKERIDLWTG
jgi:SAM-dependent methyltransferase